MRLDLEEGKRLLSEKQRLEGDANALALGEADGVLEAAAAYAHAAFMVWLQDHAELILAAAEEAEKLRELLREARNYVALWEDEAEETLYVTTLRHETALRVRIDAALTPPASLPEEIQQ